MFPQTNESQVYKCDSFPLIWRFSFSELLLFDNFYLKKIIFIFIFMFEFCEI